MEEGETELRKLGISMGSKETKQQTQPPKLLTVTPRRGQTHSGPGDEEQSNTGGDVFRNMGGHQRHSNGSIASKTETGSTPAIEGGNGTPDVDIRQHKNQDEKHDQQATKSGGENDEDRK